MSLIVETASIPAANRAPGSVEALIDQADHFAALYGVPEELTGPSYSLLRTLYEADVKSAEDSVRVLPLALATGEEILRFYADAQVNFPGIWSAALTHDVGKSTLRPGLIAKSNFGIAWDDADREETKPHAKAGADMARIAGLPEFVARPVEEHHHKQSSKDSYGTDPRLNNEERIIRDCVTIADFADAMITRVNTRNRDMSIDDKKHAIFGQISKVFDDYHAGDQLAIAVYRRVMQMLNLDS